ncbi:MAG: signal peptidase I [Candidatus Izemoplasmatales bacterium]
MKKILHRLGAALPYLVFLLAVLLVLNVVWALGRREVPSLFGYSVLYIKSGSMEPSIMTGDIIVVARTDPDDLEVGDVITFETTIEVGGNAVLTTVTHRIVTAAGEGDGRTFSTRGDANNAADDWTVTADQIVGRYLRRSVFLGNVYRFVTSGGQNLIYLGAIGLFLLIGLSEGASLVKAVNEHRRQTLEAEKAKLVEELKEELLKETHEGDPE